MVDGAVGCQGNNCLWWNTLHKLTLKLIQYKKNQRYNNTILWRDMQFHSCEPSLELKKKQQKKTVSFFSFFLKLFLFYVVLFINNVTRTKCTKMDDSSSTVLKIKSSTELSTIKKYSASMSSDKIV